MDVLVFVGTYEHGFPCYRIFDSIDLENRVYDILPIPCSIDVILSIWFVSGHMEMLIFYWEIDFKVDL